MEFNRSAFRHGLDIIEIMHAIDNAVVTVDLDPDSDPPKVLAVGVDRSGRWVEVIWLRFADVDVVIHAMKLRKVFEKFLEGDRNE